MEKAGAYSEPVKVYDDGSPHSEKGRGDLEDGAYMQNYHQLGFWTRMGCTPESFKRRTDADKSNQLNQTLKPRHLHMIAIGGSIGAGFFVGSGGALARGGSAGLLICFGIIGIMMFNVVYALGELATIFPVSGGFYTYSTRFIDPSWGFAMGWNYVMQWCAVLPLEIVVAGLAVQYWDQETSNAVWVTIFLLAIIFINIFGVLGYGEEEFWSSVLKLAAIVIFIFIGIVLVAGGGPSDGEFDSYIGGSIFIENAFTNGFKGVCSVFVTAAFAFSGTELVGLAAAEARNPRKALPGAIKQVFWRITLFYIVGLLMVGMLVRADDPLLEGNGSLNDSSTSPFVIAARRASLIGFDSFMNVVILVSVLSIGNSGVYGGSRTLTALAEQGYAPRIFTYVDRAGRPLWSTIFVIAFGLLAYLTVSSSSVEIFGWLLALSGLAAIFTWGSICVAHIRFRHAWAYHGHTVDELPFRSFFGVWGSWLALFIMLLVLIAQFWVAAFPLGSPASAEAFFNAYLALPVVLFFWAVGYLWKRQGWLRTSQIDVDTGRRKLDWEEMEREEEERRHAGPAKKVFNFLC